MLLARSMMRPRQALLLLALLCAIDRGVAADGVEEMRWTSEAKKAFATAVKEKRPLLVYFTLPECHWCVVMKTKTFDDPQVIQEVNKSFIALSPKGDDADQLAEALEVDTYPTTLIISHDKKVLARMPGYVPPATFLQRLAEATPKTLRR
jgi:uncharacterized protein YyaL (SSP411 family)